MTVPDGQKTSSKLPQPVKLLKKGVLVCGSIAASHGHKAAALLKETFLGPAPLPSCSFLPWTRPFLLQTLLDEWHKGIFLFKHSLLGTLAQLLCWCSKIVQVTAQERIGVQESARECLTYSSRVGPGSFQVRAADLGCGRTPEPSPKTQHLHNRNHRGKFLSGILPHFPSHILPFNIIHP